MKHECNHTECDMTDSGGESRKARVIFGIVSSWETVGKGAGGKLWGKRMRAKKDRLKGTRENMGEERSKRKDRRERARKGKSREETKTIKKMKENNP